MFKMTNSNHIFSLGKRWLVWTSAASIGLALLHGVVHGPLESAEVFQHKMNGTTNFDVAQMISDWAYDLRQVAEEGMFVSVIVMLYGKFAQTKTVFSVGFDMSERDRLMCSGPDENNVVWVGRKYDSIVEAELVAKTISDRLAKSPAEAVTLPQV